MKSPILEVMYAQACRPAPLFSKKNLDQLFSYPQPLDDFFLFRSLEMILFTGSIVEVISKENNILTIRAEDYPMGYLLYTDRRFFSFHRERPYKYCRQAPSREAMLEELECFPKLPYLWGGNMVEDIPEMLTYYPPGRSLNSFEERLWRLHGIDCSGLLYYVAHGALPRNTKELSHTGVEVRTPEPLDIIVWPGHILIVLEGERVIESRQVDGVIISPLKERLAQIADKPYTIRRIFDGSVLQKF